MSVKIKNITARQILDSRGDPTVEAKVELTGKITASAGAMLEFLAGEELPGIEPLKNNYGNGYLAEKLKRGTKKQK